MGGTQCETNGDPCLSHFFVMTGLYFNVIIINTLNTKGENLTLVTTSQFWSELQL